MRTADHCRYAYRSLSEVSKYGYTARDRSKYDPLYHSMKTLGIGVGGVATCSQNLWPRNRLCRLHPPACEIFRDIALQCTDSFHLPGPWIDVYLKVRLLVSILSFFSSHIHVLKSCLIVTCTVMLI